MLVYWKTLDLCLYLTRNDVNIPATPCSNVIPCYVVCSTPPLGARTPGPFPVAAHHPPAPPSWRPHAQQARTPGSPGARRAALGRPQPRAGPCLRVRAGREAFDHFDCERGSRGRPQVGTYSDQVARAASRQGVARGMFLSAGASRHGRYGLARPSTMGAAALCIEEDKTTRRECAGN